MIEFVRGTVHRVAEGHVVVDVGGIGVRVEAAPGTVAAVHPGEERELPTSLVVREDSWTLYGFADRDERDVFELVQTISGVGPRTAQALVGTLTPAGLRTAVQREDLAMLTRVPGIGKRGAQRILLELGDRLGPGPSAAPAGVQPPPGGADWRADVRSGLLSLGWNPREVEVAVTAVEPQADDGADVAALLKAALRELRRP